MHLSNTGGPKTHARDNHSHTLTRQEIVDNTEIIYRNTDWNRLQIMEALLILQRNPQINRQTTGMHRTLKLHQ